MTTPAAGPALDDAEVDAAIERLRPRDPTRLARAIYRAAFAAGLSRAQGVSVPREPTQAMIYAVQGMWGRVARGTIAEVWRAMYDAAPAPAAAPMEPQPNMPQMKLPGSDYIMPLLEPVAAPAQEPTRHPCGHLIVSDACVVCAPAPGAEDVDDEGERLYWYFESLTDPTQTQTPLSRRDAFKRTVRPLLLSATYAINKQLRDSAERDAERIAELERELNMAKADAEYHLGDSRQHLEWYKRQRDRAERLAAALRQIANMDEPTWLGLRDIARAALAGEDAP